MGRSIPVRVGNYMFANKQLLIAHMREVMTRYSVGDSLSECDSAFCMELFLWHPEAARKLNPEVTRIEVRLDLYGHKHLQIFRRDGTNDDISWKLCVERAKALT